MVYWKKFTSFFDLISSLLAKAGVAYGGLYILYVDQSPFFAPVAWLTGAFLLISLVALRCEFKLTDWQRHIYLLIQTALVSAVLLLVPDLTFFVIWLYVLSIEAVMMFRNAWGYGWIGLFTILTVFLLAYNRPFSETSIIVIVYLAGFFFFASFARTTIIAQESQEESQRLLKELQISHEKLQTYTLQAEQLAVSEERNRLAREMHDTIGHRLTVSAVHLEGAGRLITSDPEKAGTILKTVREEVREALKELRRTVATLREPLESDISLDLSIQRLVTTFEEATQIQVNLMLPEQLSALDKAQQLALFRATQEGLTNIQRHAQARRAWVQLEKKGQNLVLRVSDDGKGPANDDETNGFGLRGIQERAETLGGTSWFEERAGGGGQLIFQIPLGEKHE